MARFGRWVIVAVAAVLLASLVTRGPVLVGEQEEAAVLALLPEGGEVEGWSVAEDSLTYCPKPDSLPDIYDGGYEYYVEAGVQQAAVQAYASDADLALVYVHEMASPEQAEAIFEDSRDSVEGGSGTLSIVELKDGAFLYVGGGQSSGYLWQDRFYCNMVAGGEGESQQNAVGQFMGLLAEKIASYLGEQEAEEQ